jgi:hypothetical protein
MWEIFFSTLLQNDETRVVQRERERDADVQEMSGGNNMAESTDLDTERYQEGI